MIVGTGNVGASIAFAIINQLTPVREIILTDINTADAEGEAMDLQDTLAVAPSFLTIHAGDYVAAKDCDICVITAGANQKPGETRTDLLQKNVKILQTIIQPIMQAGFQGIFIIVSNPVDTLSYLTWQYSGLPPERVIGSGTVLDSARLRFALSERLNVNPQSIHAYQIGEHGDSEFTLWSSASLGGTPISQLLPASALPKIEQSVRTKAYDIIQKKGATYYGIGACVVKIINCILNDEKRVLPISTYDDNSNTYYGFPSVLGAEGVIRRLDVKINEQEGIKLQKSINALRATLKTAQSSS